MHSTLSRRPHLMTVAEFLDWPGDGTGRRFELVDGHPRPMSPGSETNGTIQSTLNALIYIYIYIALTGAGGPYPVVSTPGVITARHALNNMRMPELGIACAPDTGQRALPNPVALIEVLSPSNGVDTCDNVWAYTTIPSVREIVVVHATASRPSCCSAAPMAADWPSPKRLAPTAPCALRASASPVRYGLPTRGSHLG